MTDTVAAPAAPKVSKFALTNHAPASTGLFVGSATALLLAIAKQKLGLDLAGLEANVSVVVGGLAAYLTGGQS